MKRMTWKLMLNREEEMLVELKSNLGIVNRIVLNANLTRNAHREEIEIVMKMTTMEMKLRTVVTLKKIRKESKLLTKA